MDTRFPLCYRPQCFPSPHSSVSVAWPVTSSGICHPSLLVGASSLPARWKSETGISDLPLQKMLLPQHGEQIGEGEHWAGWASSEAAARVQAESNTSFSEVSARTSTGLLPVVGSSPPCVATPTTRAQGKGESFLEILIPLLGIVTLQWFSNFNVHPYYLDGFWKHRSWAPPTPKTFWFSRSAVGTRIRMSIEFQVMVKLLVWSAWSENHWV